MIKFSWWIIPFIVTIITIVSTLIPYKTISSWQYDKVFRPLIWIAANILIWLIAAVIYILTKKEPSTLITFGVQWWYIPIVISLISIVYTLMPAKLTPNDEYLKIFGYILSITSNLFAWLVALLTQIM